MKNFSIRMLTRASIIAALYVILTYVAAPIAYGPLQLRISEALCLLPLIYIESVPALYIGCMLSNIISGYGVYDIVFGSLATLIAASATYVTGRLIKNKVARLAVGGIFPVLVNAFVIPLVIYLSSSKQGYWLNFASITLTQTVFVYALGVPLILSLEKLKTKIAYLQPYQRQCLKQQSLQEKEDKKDNFDETGKN